MSRFLVFALPTLMLTFALFHVGWRAAGWPHPVDWQWASLWWFGTWLLEILGLTVLFLLLRGGGRSRWLDGITTGWVAWVFRAPLLVLTVVPSLGLSREPWWHLSLGWLALYTLCGLLLAFLAQKNSL